MMRFGRGAGARSVATAAVGVLLAGAGVGGLGTAEASAQAAPVAAGAPAGAKVTRVDRRVDIDGDGRPDTLTVTWPERYATVPVTVRVRTAAGRTAGFTLRSDAPEQGVTAWGGTAAVDGVRGREVLLVEGFGDVPHYAVYTWRGGRQGRLVRLAPPGERGAGTWTVSYGYESAGYLGYSFGTQRGVRTVTSWGLGTKTRSGRWFGRADTYRWTPAGWRLLRRATASLTATQAAALVGFGGASLQR